MSRVTRKKRYDWSKFWWKDWQNDLALKSCSYAARGLWMEMLAIMHAADRIGFFEISGRKVSAKQLAGLTNGSDREVRKLLAELEENGVFSVDDAGFIFSRRMVRDKENSDISAEHGRKGGNPALVHNDAENDGEGVNPPVKGQDKPRDKLKKLEARNTPIVPLPGDEFFDDAEQPSAPRPKTRRASSPAPDEAAFERFWAAYPRKVGKPKARRAFATAIGKASLETLLAAIVATPWSSDANYIPHPATWLNNERWADEGVLPEPAADEMKYDRAAYDEAARRWAKNGYEGLSPRLEHFPLKEAAHG
ncbi:hypothetical protein [Komagataeibacter diospyri]|uniref:hypothetical protein n=1 Tax=Komagataeibacter diospyri TaxID=1932662 RepID=UPI003756F26D